MTISTDPRMWDVYVTIITCGGVTTGEDSLIPQVQLVGKKKVQFDVNAEKDTFFEAWDEIRRKLGKLHIYEMSIAFDSTLEAGPS